MHSYILYLNILLIFVLTLIIASTLISKKDDLKTRLSFSFFFLIVIINCVININVLYFGNYQHIFMLFSYASCGFLFGPMLLQYVYFLLDQKLPKWWKLNYILSLLFFILGFYYLFIPVDTQKKYLQEMLDGVNAELGILNLLILFHCFIYFIMVRLFLNKFKVDEKDIQLNCKRKWASNFVNYMILCNILILICYIFMSIYFVKSLVLGDLVVMPLIILSVYSFIVIKNGQQHKEAEFNFALSLIENQNRLQEQRINISRDLHDNIGSQLTFIISSIDNIKKQFDINNPKLDNQLNHVSNFTKDTIVELRDTIWALNTENLSIQELEHRILNFNKDASESLENMHFDYKNNIKVNHQISSKQGINLFRVFQEAVSNAIKHANPEKISIELNEINQQLEMKINDNGTGFDYQEKKKKSYGLTNMKNRIEELNGVFSLKSSTNGTSITITIPIVT